MILGTFLVSVSFIFCVFIIFVDRKWEKIGNTTLSDMGRTLHISWRAHFAVYGICVLSVGTSLAVFIFESGNPFLKEAFPIFNQLLIWGCLLVLVGVENLRRFKWQKEGEDSRRALYEALEDTVENAPSPVEGINHVINYVQERPSEFNSKTVEEFLSYLSQREDEIGELATQYLRNRQIL
ncbi:MAG: hypothetical protein ACOC38_07760 [Promethearchaeia archaeon]